MKKKEVSPEIKQEGRKRRKRKVSKALTPQDDLYSLLAEEDQDKPKSKEPLDNTIIINIRKKRVKKELEKAQVKSKKEEKVKAQEKAKSESKVLKVKKEPVTETMKIAEKPQRKSRKREEKVNLTLKGTDLAFECKNAKKMLKNLGGLQRRKELVSFSKSFHVIRSHLSIKVLGTQLPFQLGSGALKVLKEGREKLSLPLILEGFSEDEKEYDYFVLFVYNQQT